MDVVAPVSFAEALAVTTRRCPGYTCRTCLLLETLTEEDRAQFAAAVTSGLPFRVLGDALRAATGKDISSAAVRGHVTQVNRFCTHLTPRPWLARYPARPS